MCPEGFGVGKPSQDLQELDKSTTKLGVAGTYKGDWIAVDGFGKLGVLVNTDQDGTAYVEQSRDASTVLHRTTRTITAANLPEDGGAEISIIAPYARIRYLNGGVAQGSFDFSMNGRVI